MTTQRVNFMGRSGPDSRLYPALLGVIIALFIVIGALYAAKTPPWQAPDEPAHYNYAEQIATDGCCPIITGADWDANYLESLKATGFPDDAALSDIEYEDHQPPLYYLIAAQVYRFTDGKLFWMRMFSVLLGAGVVASAYSVVIRLFPSQPVLALGAAMFVGFIPQHIAILASVNNDSLAEMLLGVLLAISISYLGNPSSHNRW